MKLLVAFSLLFVGVLLSTGHALSQAAPDLVLTDIIHRQPISTYRPQGRFIINTVVSNLGADVKQGFDVNCFYYCGSTIVQFSGMRALNGLGSGASKTLGGDAERDIPDDCQFQAQREFTCIVDFQDLVKEVNEQNNERKEVLFIGR